MESYLTVCGENQHKIEINRSVFICSIKGVKDFDEGMDYVKSTSKKYSNATHNCYAIITIDNKQKFSDDGEPGGTAGQPILQALKNKNLNNVAAIVTRYFGGIKLGAGGLVSAYASSVTETLAEAKIIRMKLCTEGSVNVEYNELTAILNYLRETKCVHLDTHYSDCVQVKMACPIEEKQKAEQYIASATSGKSIVNWQGEDYHAFNS